MMLPLSNFLAISLLVYAISIPSVNVAIAMAYVMGIGDATAQSGIYVSVEKNSTARCA
jgi:hypothetical protein